jgi:sodium/potassium-transporting ATPase subunit alpha
LHVRAIKPGRKEVEKNKRLSMPYDSKGANPVQDVQLQSLNELFAALGSGESGLSSSDAEARLARFGPNELRVRGEVPEIVKFLRQFGNFFALLLVAGGVLALLADYLDPGQGNFYIACALFGVVVLNATFTYLQEHQSEKIMESFRRMLPAMVVVLRDGRPEQIEARTLVPGDIIELSEGDRVPADCRLIEANGLTVDSSSLTGESDPQELDPSKSDEVLLQSRNMMFSGSLVQGATRVQSSAEPVWRPRSAISSS